MMPPVDLRPYLDVLERFADGQMTPTEQEAFEERLQQEDDLPLAHAAYEQLTADLRWVAGHETLRLRLQNLDRRLDQRQDALVRMQQQQRHTQNRWLVLIVGALVVALVAWLFTRRATPATTATTWAQYYQPDPGLPAPDSRLDTRPLLSEAMSQYREGHYQAALHALRRIPTDNIGQDTLLYYSGIFLLRQGDAAGARPFLRRVSQQSAAPLAPKALYHLGMAHWQANDLPEARAVLTQVSTNSRNVYQQAAQRALQTEALRP